MENNSIVIQLQLLATNKDNNISDLLRRALIVATKLELEDFKSWIRNELYGYTDKAKIPPYRKVYAELYLKSLTGRLIPMIFDDPKVTNILCYKELANSVESLYTLTKNEKNNGQLAIPLNNAESRFLLECQNKYGRLEPVRIVSANCISSILDSVRTTILEWALRLEQDGVIGDKISFTKEEKIIASQNSNIHINNFQGIWGNVSNSTVDQDLTLTVSEGDFQSLESFLSKNGVEHSDIQDLQTALSEDITPSKSGEYGLKVSSWLSEMIKKCLLGTWTLGKSVGVSTAAKLLSDAITRYYGLN